MQGLGVLIPAVFFFIMGMLFFGIGFLLTKKMKKWIQTIGRVGASAQAPSDASQRSVVEFEAKDGKIYEVPSDAKRRTFLPIGSRVPVMYHSENPQQARIDWTIYIGRFFMAFGSLFMLIGIVIAAFVWTII